MMKDGISRPRRAVEIALVLAGVVVAANALVCGPHAFTYGSFAVAMMVVADVALVGAGFWELRPRQRDEKAENKQE